MGNLGPADESRLAAPFDHIELDEVLPPLLAESQKGRIGRPLEAQDLHLATVEVDPVRIDQEVGLEDTFPARLLGTQEPRRSEAVDRHL